MVVFVYFLKIIKTFKKIKYLYIKDFQKPDSKIFAKKGLLVKQIGVLDRELNSTSFDDRGLYCKNCWNLQKNRIHFDH